MADYTVRNTVTVVPLDGSNYGTWKIQCRMALIKENLWSIVSGTEVAPAETEVEKFTKFVVRRNRALATIVLSVNTSLLYLLGDPEDPVVVWKKLSEQFQKKTWANKLSLRRRLNKLRLQEGDSVKGHIKSITEIFNELAVIGAPMEEEDKVVTLLASLPDKFDMLVTALEANSEVPNMEVVTERLFHEENKLKERETVEKPYEKVMLGTKSKDRPKCHHCGKPAYAHIPKDERKKLDPKARKCVFLVYGTDTKAYRLFDVERQRVIYSRDVKFDEGAFGILQKDKPDGTVIKLVDVELSNNDDVELSNNDDVDEGPSVLRQSSRERRPPDRLGEWVTVVSDGIVEPTTVSEALNGPDADQWHVAMQQEMDSLHKHDVWNLTELPDGRKAVGSPSDEKIAEVKQNISERFEVKDMGELKYFLGVQVIQEDGKVWIGQPTYTENILKKFGMENCKPIQFPSYIHADHGSARGIVEESVGC
ncbi:hypothetical protein QZH41_007205 [Actinostola sp. cb2023]|nr:hypothetical protein QZH41_007205 [Actinostola sp. cb2023]